MKKSMITLAVAGVVAAPMATAAVTASGFIDVTHTFSNDYGDPTPWAIANNTPAGSATAKNTLDGKFDASAELDLTHSSGPVTARVDLDFHGGSVVTEQVLAAFAFNPSFTAVGGIFNSNFGMDAQDAPDMLSINNGQIFDIIDGTHLDNVAQRAIDDSGLGDNLPSLGSAVNVAGLAAVFSGPATVTLAYVNDIDTVEEENSVALLVNKSMWGWDFEFGYLNQTSQTLASPANASKSGAKSNLGNVIDFNAMGPVMGTPCTAGIDILAADNYVDTAYGVVATCNVGVNLHVRYDSVSYTAGDFDKLIAPAPNTITNVDDTTSVTLAASHHLAPDLDVILEYKQSDEIDYQKSSASGNNLSLNTDSRDQIMLEIVGTF